MSAKQAIKADNTTAQKLPKILGVFEGECADADITNNNGLDITRDVWTNVFESDDYKQAIDLGWYIGFLGHPDDPNCMDFKNACIVMTEGHIHENGKVYGKFNLIDTPVGQIVKAFIDAGVTFGISVRGAGDIVNNSVDPETFIFRGFDLVTFPAYPEAIPTFQEIAASSDVEKQKKYKYVCAAVKSNLTQLNSVSAIDIIQKQFAPQSEEYKALEIRRSEITASSDIDACNIDILQSKVNAMTNMYLDQVQRCNELEAKLRSATIAANRKIRTIERITANQILELNEDNKRLRAAHHTAIAANSRLKDEISEIADSNLKYKHTIDAANKEIKKKDSIISSLRTELNETVSAASEVKSRSSNLGEVNMKLRSDLKAAMQLVSEYQDAYATMYANAIGVSIDGVKVNATTSVDEIQKIVCSISGATNTSNISAEPMQLDILDVELDDATIVSL